MSSRTYSSCEMGDEGKELLTDRDLKGLSRKEERAFISQARSERRRGKKKGKGERERETYDQQPFQQLC
jgi:hypothetical protein